MYVRYCMIDGTFIRRPLFALLHSALYGIPRPPCLNMIIFIPAVGKNELKRILPK